MKTQQKDKKKIAIIGSINTDFSFFGEKIPSPSETLSGSGFKTSFGGKGANESIACARLGAEVALFGKVGNDEFSKKNLENLKKNGVKISGIGISKNSTCGVAGIFVGSNTNSIMVVPGANGEVDKNYIDENIDEILKNDIFCLQLEIPLETTKYIIEKLNKANKTIIFNPSPICDLPLELYNKCSYVVVNEIEVKYLPGYISDSQILKDFGGKLIITYGKDGVDFYQNGIKHIDAIKIDKVVDTTGAGDTFLGALAVGLCEGKTLCDAISFANLCAGLKTQKSGAQEGMPYRKEVES